VRRSKQRNHADSLARGRGAITLCRAAAPAPRSPPPAALSVGFPQRSSRSAPSLGNADLVYGNMMPEGALEKTTHLG